jgi:hypothetical protein
VGAARLNPVDVDAPSARNQIWLTVARLAADQNATNDPSGALDHPINGHSADLPRKIGAADYLDTEKMTPRSNR